VDSKAFSLTKLLHDILGSDVKIKRWQDFENLVVSSCKLQDPKCIRNKDVDPDVTLTNGYGIEAKSISSTTRGINLNSAAPDSQTFYVVGHCSSNKVKHVAIVSGANFYCSEIDDLKKTNTSLRKLSNAKVHYRTRIMWQIVSPFETWGVGNFIVDKLGKVTHC
jgi:hypothetical protein